MDPRRAPQRVRRAHLVDECPNGGRGAAPARATGRRAVGPSASEPLPMPTDDRLGLHDDQGRTPVSPGMSEQHPKQSISRTEWRTLDRALEHRQLLTEGQVLKRDRAVSAADQCEGTEQDKKRGGHERSCAAIDQKINQSRRFGFWRMTGATRCRARSTIFMKNITTQTNALARWCRY